MDGSMAATSLSSEGNFGMFTVHFRPVVMPR